MIDKSDFDGEEVAKAILRESRLKWIKSFPDYVCDYHYIVGPTGRVFTGQPEDLPAWHATNYKVNLSSIGICFLGNFEQELMHKAQFDSGIKLVRELMDKFNVPLSGVLRHKDVVSDITGRSNSTQCPGKNFPFSEFTNKLVRPFKDVDENYPYFSTVDTLKKKGILLGSDGFFRPKDFATREEVAIMLERVINLFTN
jgi:hypothetical protein